MVIALTRTTGHRVKSTLEPQVAEALLRAELGHGFSILGMHTTAEGLVVRVFLPDAAAVRILERGGEGLAYESNKTHSEGIFEASIVERRELFSYEIEIVDHLGAKSRCRAPYSFWPMWPPRTNISSMRARTTAPTMCSARIRGASTK